MLYLVELAQAGTANPSGDALLGGPRIGEEAWQLLWGQLFEAPRIPNAPGFSRTSSGTGYSEEEEEDPNEDERDHHSSNAEGQSRSSILPTNAMRSGSRLRHTQNRAGSPSDLLSDASSLVDADAADTSEDADHSNLAMSSGAGAGSRRDNLSLVSHATGSSSSSPYSLNSSTMSGTRLAKSHNTGTTSNTTLENASYSSQSSHNRGKPRSHRHGLIAGADSRTASRQGNLSNQSRASVHTRRSYSNSIGSNEGPQSSGPVYGEAVIVGKLEFDIDSRRGGGRWFDAWLETANSSSSADSAHMATPGGANSGSRHSAYPRGGTSHPESNLGTLLRSRGPSSTTMSILNPEHFAISSSMGGSPGARRSAGLPAGSDGHLSIIRGNSPAHADPFTQPTASLTAASQSPALSPDGAARHAGQGESVQDIQQPRDAPTRFHS